MRKHYRQLDISVEMSGPHDSAVRARCRSSCDTRASIASRSPTHRDDREAPLLEGAGRREVLEMICPTGAANYFCVEGWTIESALIAFMKFAFSRKPSAASSGVDDFSSVRSRSPISSQIARVCVLSMAEPSMAKTAAHFNKTETVAFGYPSARLFLNSGSQDLWLSATGAVYQTAGNGLVLEKSETRFLVPGEI